MTLSVVEGEPATRIVEFVQNNDVDLIILSTHGGSGLTGWNISSVVQKTVIRVQKPTMIVRSDPRWGTRRDQLQTPFEPHYARAGS